MNTLCLFKCPKDISHFISQLSKEVHIRVSLSTLNFLDEDDP
jgi:hypothetical protein